MFGTVLVFLLLSANLNAQPTEVDNSVEEREIAAEITLLELELQSMYDRNADSEDVQKVENRLSDLYNQDEQRGIKSLACKFLCLPVICPSCRKFKFGR